MKMMQLTKREYEEHVNTVFCRTIDFLHEKEFITDEQAEELAHYAVITRKPSYFQRMKMFFKGSKLDDVDFLIIVKEASLSLVNQAALSKKNMDALAKKAVKGP